MTNCQFDSNTQGAWAIRNTAKKDVVRSNNKVTNNNNNNVDTNFSKVRTLFSSPNATATMEKELGKHGYTAEDAKGMAANERRMREATMFKAKFLNGYPIFNR